MNYLLDFNDAQCQATKNAGTIAGGEDFDNCVIDYLIKSYKLVPMFPRISVLSENSSVRLRRPRGYFLANKAHIEIECFKDGNRVVQSAQFESNLTAI